MTDLTKLTVRRRRSVWLAPLFLLAAIAVIVGVGQAERTPSPLDNLPDGLDSTTVVELSDQLPQESGSTAVVLYTADEGKLSAQAIQELEARYPSSDRGPGLMVSDDGTAAIAVVPVMEQGATAIADKVAEIRDQAAQDLPDGVSSAVTGPAAIQADLAAVFEGADVTLLLATASVVAVLLLITYRSPFLWLIPLTVVAVADQLAATLATHALKLGGLSWDESTVGILSVLVFGAGTDYALLLISRYRDELRTTEDRYAAMRHALGRTAESIIASATTVVLGLLTLLLSLVPATRGLGLACAVGILVAATYALVVLPTVLVLFGRWVFWPVVPRVGQQTLVESDRSLWRRIGNAVAQRPGSFVTGSLVVLALLAVGTTQIQSGLSQAEQFLDTPEAISAGERLAQSFPAGASDPTIVLTRADGDQIAQTASDVEGVVSATPTVSDGSLTQVNVVLDAAGGSPEARGLVTDLREALAAYDDTWVGGSEAEAVDEASAAARDRKLIIPLILVLVLGALVLLLRSVAAPIILVATVVATYLAALGSSWWLFTGPLGFERLDSGVPLLAFLFLVALGVDYNIFLVSRAAEEARDHGTQEGMLRALTATGGVITSAGILLAAVFAVLGVLPLVVLAQLGVVIFVGVLLDTLLVRTVLVPAIALKTRDRFWWPREVGPAS
jgi:putative drug exporter of the RND superfamily